MCPLIVVIAALVAAAIGVLVAALCRVRTETCEEVPLGVEAGVAHLTWEHLPRDVQ